jgi:hypothetical protein
MEPVGVLAARGVDGQKTPQPSAGARHAEAGRLPMCSVSISPVAREPQTADADAWLLMPSMRAIFMTPGVVALAKVGVRLHRRDADCHLYLVTFPKMVVGM